ncbi:MAG: UDP-N-acetylglucosamine--N-acetylmuramyl-(pentapeptide) pyrophosphoryl-undecaprenol N-acetylglucosamine transferase [Defluviitoga tunisiensis]|jgi:UDP-N-acetylglucosamine--N-acetylmuramyl-(pentapeptide) pyrophosphoryl-undecaprenol N-acetylglucosamine transferase
MKNNKRLKVVFSGGGTGGHYYPAIALLKYLENKYQNLEVIYFATKGRIEEKNLAKDFPNAKMYTLDTKGLERPIYNPKNFSRMIEVLKDTRKARKIIKSFDPDFAFLTGGYVTVPVGIALKNEKIPFYLHEQNSIMGISNKLLSKYAKKVFVSFQETIINEKCILSGNPVRTPDEKITRNYLKKYGINNLNKRCILVFGGSLSSEEIDDIMYRVYLQDKSTNYIHVTKNPDKFTAFENVYTFDYIDDLYKIMAVCDGVVCRAGATTIAEIIFYNLQAALIPWKGAAENHQFKNALSLQKLGKAEVFDDQNIDLTKLINFINSIEVKSQDYEYIPKPNMAIEIIINNIEEIINDNF